MTPAMEAGVAMRLGVAKHRGRTFTNAYTNKQSVVHPRLLQHRHFLSFEQRGVDMRIGIDVATLSLKKIVNRISGDTDMIPAMKLARHEGIQVIMVEVAGANSCPIAKSQDEDADLVRTITPVV